MRSEINAGVWQVLVRPGEVELDQQLLVLESMKTEIPVTALKGGVVAKVLVAAKNQVVERQVLVVIDG